MCRRSIPSDTAAGRMLAWLASATSPREDASARSLPCSSHSPSDAGDSSQPTGESETSLECWLESIKPGYAGRFTPAFMAVGVEDVLDLPNIDQDIFRDIERELEARGAKKMHLKNIRALKDFGFPPLPPPCRALA